MRRREAPRDHPASLHLSWKGAGGSHSTKGCATFQVPDPLLLALGERFQPNSFETVSALQNLG